MGSIQQMIDHDAHPLPVAALSAMATMIVFVAVGATTTLCIALAIYRLLFSPLALAGVPGPKIAAITAWYEFYWDCVQQGQFLFKIEQMHQKYGPFFLLFLLLSPHLYPVISYSLSGLTGSLVNWSISRTTKTLTDELTLDRPHRAYQSVGSPHPRPLVLGHHLHQQQNRQRCLVLPRLWRQ